MNRQFIREMINRYILRVDGRFAYNQDAYYHQQWRWIESMLQTVDMVLEDCEIPDAVRHRVITTVIYGGPDPSEAEKRIEWTKAEIERLSITPPKPFDLGVLGG